VINGFIPVIGLVAKVCFPSSMCVLSCSAVVFLVVNWVVMLSLVFIIAFV